MTDWHRSTLLRVSAYATVLVAFFLRVYRLADKNIWWDEGWSLWLAQKDWSWIALRTAADEHPPLHYWMLSAWDSITGWNAFAGRYLSVAFGVLTVALIYRIGKRIGGTGIGLLAALLLAAARFHIWWSQDIKNYSPSILFAFAALWFALTLLEKPNRKAVAGYAIYAALALWTHYLAAFVLLAVNVYAGLVFLAERVIRNRQASSHCEKDGELRRTTKQSFVMHEEPRNQKIASHKPLAMTVPLSARPVPSNADLRETQNAKLVYWLAANVLGALLFIPWLWLYLQNAAQWTAAPAFDFGLFLKLVATVLPLGVTTNIDNYALVTIALTALALLGAISGYVRRRMGQDAEGTGHGGRGVRDRWAASSKQLTVDSEQLERNTEHTTRGTTVRVRPTVHYPFLFTLIVVLPPLVLYALSLTPVAFFAPKIQARYLLVLFPAYAVLLALGIGLLRRLSLYAGAIVVVFLLAVNILVLRDYYAERRLTDEYATLANTINAFSRPGDIVLLDTDQEWPTFLYYMRTPLEWLGVPNGQTMTATNAEALVQRVLTRDRSVWLVAIPDGLATDPQHLIESRLARALPRQFEQTFGDKRIALYSAERRDLSSVPRENFAPQHPATGQGNGALQFLGFDLATNEVRAGDSVRVVTYWNANTASDVPIGLDSVSQMAHIPPGERVRVETDFVAPSNGLGNARLYAGDAVLANVAIQPRAALEAAGPITHPVDYSLGEAIHLAGYDLPADAFYPGDTVSLTLYWRAERAVGTNYVVFVHLLGDQFNTVQGNFLWGQVDRGPRDGTYPTAAWAPNETVPDAYRVPIDARAPAGSYKIEVGLYDPATGVRLAVNGEQDSVILDRIEVR